MKTALLLYLCVKLDDIVNLLQNDYGISFFVAFIVTTAIAVKSGFYEDYDGDHYPLSGFVSKAGELKEVRDQLKKWSVKALKIPLYLFISQMIMNGIATALPTTKQMAVIYAVSTGVQSETFNALRSLDGDFADYIQRQAKEWFREQYPVDEGEKK